MRSGRVVPAEPTLPAAWTACWPGDSRPGTGWGLFIHSFIVFLNNLIVFIFVFIVDFLFILIFLPYLSPVQHAALGDRKWDGGQRAVGQGQASDGAGWQEGERVDPGQWIAGQVQGLQVGQTDEHLWTQMLETILGSFI
jgi:hypothetical protein